MNVIGMVSHWQRCSLSLKWCCLICNEYSITSIKKFYLHLLNHDNSSKSVVNKSNLSSGHKSTICYRDLQVPEMDKHGGLEKMNLNPKLVTWTYDYYLRHHSEEIFSRFRPASGDWTPLESLEEYLPSQKESINFKVRGVEESTSGSWMTLKLFEAQDPSTAEQVTMNIGGPVWASAWCPVPMSEGSKADQYAAISCNLDNEFQRKLDHVEADKGLVQIWNFGNLSRTTLETTPKMVFTIAHNYGIVWDLKWCPSGCWEDPDISQEDSDYLPRLGLLALACGDGNVRILSIPHPKFLSTNEQATPQCFYSVSPVCVLPPPEPGIIVNSFKTACTCIAFEKTDGHGKIATGYGNGLICLWDLQSDSPLILARRRQIEPEPLPQLLRPFHHFLAHSAGITSLTFSPVPQGRFLNSAGMDKLFKLWDLDDTSVPVDQAKKCLARKLESSCHSCGVFVAMDQGYNVNLTHSLYKESGYFDYTTLGTSYSNSCIWDLSISEWLNSELTSNAAGAVNLITLPLLTKNLEHFKTFKNFRWPIYYTDITPLEESNTNPAESSLSSPTNDDTFAKISSHYGLVFRDAPLSSINQLSSPNIKQLTKPEHMKTCAHGQYPLASVNTVCWNPNLGCHLWFLSAGQSGLARLSCMSALRQPAASRLIAKLQQNNEKT